MSFSPRYASHELLKSRKLVPRKELLAKDHQYYLSLEKGFDGELQFDNMLEGINDDWIKIDDLLLEYGHTFFQIDSLIISQKSIYLFDIKNYEGEFIVKGDNWESVKGKEIKNPLHQLSRCETLFNRFLQDLGYHYPVSSYLVFINSQFTLYQAPYPSPIILPTQLNSLIQQLEKLDSRISEKHTTLATKLVSSSSTNYPNAFIPKYEFEELEKGVVCKFCKNLIIEKNDWLVVCHKCGQSEDIESAILRSLEDYCFLFPEKKITTADLLTWCAIFKSKRTIHRILVKNLKRIGQGKYSYYVRQ